jgi:hypothetical protein
MTRDVIHRNRQLLRALRAGAETASAGIAEAGAWFAIVPDVKATEIGLLDTGPFGARIGIRKVTTSNVCGPSAQSPSVFRVSATAVVVCGGTVDPISAPGATIAIGHLQPPGLSSASNGI